ncbi:MAG: hypothetical protein C1O27_000431 [Chloroflexi bacterium]|jgi:hypothetical protein|nr:MAG: hypothetical protein C1O27_000431 [Chloroflexota bacterium]
MSVGSALLRAAVALLLSVPAFFGYAYFLSAGLVEKVALDPSHAIRALEKADAYTRIHDTDLLQKQFEDISDSLLGHFDIDRSDRVKLQREILTPSHLKTEIERNLKALSEFMRFDSDVLEVSVLLAPAVDRVEPALFAFLDSRIESIEPEPLTDPDELALRLHVTLQSIAEGQIAVAPPPMPLDNVDPLVGERAYHLALEELQASFSVPAPVIANLIRNEDSILSAINTGDLRQGIKLAAHAATEPRINDALSDLRQRLDSDGYLDLVDRLAEDVGSREAVVRDAETTRTWLRFGTWLGPWLALGLMAFSTIAMGLIFSPFVPHMLRWPSLSLLISGLEFLTLGLAATQNRLGFISSACGRGEAGCSLITDVAKHLTQDVGSSLIAPSAFIVVLGVIGMVASFFLDRRQVQPSAVGGKPLEMPDRES